MKVQEFKKIIECLPDDTEICIYVDEDTIPKPITEKSIVWHPTQKILELYI